MHSRERVCLCVWWMDGWVGGWVFESPSNLISHECVNTKPLLILFYQHCVLNGMIMPSATNVSTVTAADSLCPSLFLRAERVNRHNG